MVCMSSDGSLGRYGGMGKILVLGDLRLGVCLTSGSTTTFSECGGAVSNHACLSVFTAFVREGDDEADSCKDG